MINYFLHFLGAFLFVLIFKKWFLLHTSCHLTLLCAILWELAQFDSWWGGYGYNPFYIFEYNWLDTGLDVLMAIIGMAAAILVFGIIYMHWLRIWKNTTLNAVRRMKTR